ncbi:MAG TPA: hypothetical protein VIM49_03985 [Dermatophilaceae bacterium]
MTAPRMGVTAVISTRSCGRPETIHSGPEMSTPAIHPSYTER